jgi:hypothetical protein
MISYIGLLHDSPNFMQKSECPCWAVEVVELCGDVKQLVSVPVGPWR